MLFSRPLFSYLKICELHLLDPGLLDMTPISSIHLVTALTIRRRLPLAKTLRYGTR